MPYNSVSSAREDIPSLKNLSTSQVKKFIRIFNNLVRSGEDESKAIPIAISQVKKVNKMDNKFLQFMYGMYQAFPDMFSPKTENEDEEMEIEEACMSYDGVHKSDNNSINVVKQFDEEEMIALEPLYINVGGADAHGDGITDEHLDKMIDNFNSHIDNIKGNIHHSFMTQGFKPIKSYRMPVTVYVGDPSKPHDMVKIEEGMPVVKIQYAKNDLGRKYWKMRKEGKLGAPSIGATGKRVPNPDYKGDTE